MTLITLGDAVIHKEIFSHPHPPIMTHSVRNKNHIKDLADIQKEFALGCIYAYVDIESNSFYIGETGSTLWSRHVNHVNQEWFKSMESPLVLVAQNRLHDSEDEWTIHPRRLMEANLVKSLYDFGMIPANKETSTWKNIDLDDHHKGSLWEACVNTIKIHIGSYLGVNLLTYSTLLPASPSSVGDSPGDNKIIAKRRGCEIFGTELADGSIHIYKSINVPFNCTPSAKNHTIKRHEDFLRQAKLNDNGQYDWEGSIIANKRTSYLSVIFGAETSDIWEKVKS